jgi:hypothetical protein
MEGYLTDDELFALRQADIIVSLIADHNIPQPLIDELVRRSKEWKRSLIGNEQIIIVTLPFPSESKPTNFRIPATQRHANLEGHYLERAKI